MNSYASFKGKRLRFFMFAGAAALHVALITGIAFRMETAAKQEEPVAGVMKLMDVEEELPPPPPERPPELPRTNTNEAIAETVIETDEEPPPPSAPSAAAAAPELIEYVSQARISVLPVLPEDEIRRATVYPPIARRSGIEGMVYLELFIDRQGNIREARILRERPEGRGFGEAAANAFRGIRGKPAEANGDPVAVRFRYNITFRLN